jgi:hypothetical protein
MKIKPFTCFLCAVAVILIAAAPFVVQTCFEELPEIQGYKGVLTLWNITDWRTAGSSCASYLKKRVESFESRNAYIFIDIVNLSKEEAAESVINGEAPDIISYPLGFDSGLDVFSLPHVDTIFPKIKDTAYPYMCGAYCMAVNTDMLDEVGLFAPSGWGIRPDDLIEIAKLGVCFDSEKGYSSLPAVAVHEYPETEGPGLSTWEEPELPDAALSISVADYSNGLNCFCSEKACIMIASQRQLFELTELNLDGSAPAFQPYAFSGYTDMVQLVSVASCENNKKLAACIEFAQYLLSEESQKKLEALGVFPVLPGLPVYSASDCFRDMYGLLSEHACLAPPEEREYIDSLSKEALGGNKSALQQLRNMLD